MKMVAATAAVETIQPDPLFQQGFNHVLHCGIWLEIDTFIQRLRRDFDFGMMEAVGNQYGCEVILSKNVPARQDKVGSWELRKKYGKLGKQYEKL